jgi:imidazolonepropionase-like amidohydrolase
LEHRIGYAKVGYDADLVLWDEHPLRLGATPVQVWIDGLSNLESSRSELAKPMLDALRAPKQRKFDPSARWKENCKIGARNLVVRGISKSFLEDFRVQEGNNTLILEEGRIICIGKCSAEEKRLTKKGVSIMSLKDGYIVPVCCFA